MYTAINQAFSLFESTDDSILRMMVVLSDGNTSDRGMHSSVVTSATRNNIGHVFSWLPTTEQWLITGFNANIKNLDLSYNEFGIIATMPKKILCRSFTLINIIVGIVYNSSA